MITAYYSGYTRAGISRVHIVRTTPIPRRWDSRTVPGTQQAWCNASTHHSPAAPKVPVDPAEPLTDGLEWCGTCLGKAAEDAGLLAAVAALLVAKGDET